MLELGKYDEAVAYSLKPILEELENRLQSAFKSMQRVQSELAEAMGQLEETLDDANERMDQLETACAAICDEALEEFDNIEDIRSEAVDEFDSAADEMVAKLEEVSEGAAKIRENASVQVLEVRDQAIEMVETQIQLPITQYRAEAIAEIQHLMDEHVHQTITDQADKVVNECLEQVRSSVDEGVSRLTDGLDEFREQIIGDAESAAEGREESSIAREMLDDAFQPVMQELQRVISLADSVGISIG